MILRRTLPIAALLLAGCSSSLQGGGTVSSAPLQSPSVAAVASSTSAADANRAVCDAVHSYMAGTVRATYDSWNTNTLLFDQRVARQMRAEATHLWAVSDTATGAVLKAIEDEASAIANLSVAIQGRDIQSVGAQSNAGNSALAELRGVCGF
jgi:hypothetical protein